MSASHDKPEGALENLIELAALGADWAATALAQLVGRRVSSSAPVLCEASASQWAGSCRTAIFFETEGSLPGLIAILLTVDSRDVMLRMLLGENGDPDPEAQMSALCELGNIVASQTVSAMANDLGETVLLSVPQLMDGDVETHLAKALVTRRSGGGSARIESALCDTQGEVYARLVIAPDALDEIGG
jgi:chemotaxis protein CheC